MNSVASSFRDLNVYKKTREVAGRIYVLTKAFPKDETYSMTDQIRRSSRAVKAMLAEAWARRRYKAVFVNKIDEALGEATETQSWLDDALDCSYITAQVHQELDQAVQEIGGMLSNMIKKADDFCKTSS